MVRRAVDTTVEGQGFRCGLASSGGGIGVEVAQVQSWLAGQQHSSLLHVLLLMLTFDSLGFFRSTVKLSIQEL